MFVNERYDEILRLLKEQKSVSASELAKRFQVSLETIRRDLFALEGRNLLQRVHGGAIAVSEMHEYKSLRRRLEENVAKKLEASENAMQFIREGDVIMVDTGSTAVEFAKVLKSRFRSLTVITCSLDVYMELKDASGIRLIIVGGEYVPEERSNGGPLAVDMIHTLNALKAFIFPLGISLKKGFSDQDPRWIAIQRAYMERSDKTYFVADSTKFETAALAKICNLEAGQTIVTDAGVNSEIRTAYAENGIEIYC